MIVNSSDLEILAAIAADKQTIGYQYTVFPLHQISDFGTLEFFETPLKARECCLEKSNAVEQYQWMPIASMRGDLKIVIESGITTSNEVLVLDLTSYARLLRDSSEIVENNLNTNVMNQKNLEFLADQIKYTGFGETLQGVLKEKMEKGEKEFTIPHEAKFDNGTLSSELSFKKSDQSDLYFFNSYKAVLQKEGAAHAPEQIFYVSKDNTFTMKEAFNLLDGRAVNKDLKNKQGEVYNSYVQLDFKDAEPNGNFKMNHYHQNYGFDLEAALSKHSIKELETPKFKEDLLNSLKKGNLQSVTFVVSGVESKHYVEANPRFKTVNVYDTNMQRINHRESKEEKLQQGQEKSVSKKQAKDLDGEPEAAGQKESKKRKVKSQSM
ncbi:hypothetical protein [Flavobacterium sp. ACN6]|uniref:hypothetical protein n=1 Tax=Flavobacterium sp. ACN6 TaxID=1920426 RepID=UPI001D606F41|nr:hypothetical protein [Flavobacterium sp. ACN6]PBJ08023.1 hypothetical protein BSF42_37400 [Flavobacterium sp. ACN6]